MARLVAALSCIGLLALGCAYSQRISLPRSSQEQLLATEAIDRALTKLDWPDVSGSSLRIQLGAPEESYDRDYLLRSVEIEVARRGGMVVDASGEVDYQLNVLVGAIGVDTSGRFFGVQGASGSSLIPFTIPEVALYKTRRRDGFAKLGIALLDPRSGTVVHHSGPEMATSYARTRTLMLVFRRRWTDITRFEREEASDEDSY
jgi:hypothetical protein